MCPRQKALLSGKARYWGKILVRISFCISLCTSLKLTNIVVALFDPVPAVRLDCSSPEHGTYTLPHAEIVSLDACHANGLIGSRKFR